MFTCKLGAKAQSDAPSLPRYAAGLESTHEAVHALAVGSHLQVEIMFEQANAVCIAFFKSYALDGDVIAFIAQSLIEARNGDLDFEDLCNVVRVAFVRGYRGHDVLLTG